MSESPDNSNREFEQQLREQLRGSEAGLDTRTRARIAAARREALEQEDGRWSLGIGRPAWGTLAVAAIVATLVYMPRDMDEATPLLAEQTAKPTPAPDEDEQLELYENLELLEFYEELEFYEWLADAQLEEMPS